MLTSLWKIQSNRNFILNFYIDVEYKIDSVYKNVQKDTTVSVSLDETVKGNGLFDGAGQRNYTLKKITENLKIA